MITSERLEELLAVSLNGSAFRSYSARNILFEIRLKPELKWDVCFYLLISAMARYDIEACRKFVYDWSGGAQPTALISRFIPGSHWHVLDTKFSSFDAARRHLEKQGYRYAGTRTVHARKEGD